MPPRKKQIPKAVKREVWNKNIGEEIGKSKCKCCEKADISQLNFHCGHIQSEANGGEIHVNNLLPICEVCNKSMGTKNLYEFKKMLVEPKQIIENIPVMPKFLTSHNFLNNTENENGIFGAFGGIQKSTMEKLIDKQLIDKYNNFLEIEKQQTTDNVGIVSTYKKIPWC
jgi:hypothetical protein